MLKGDFHSHTVFSRHPFLERFGLLDGIDTLDAMVRVAAKNGLDVLAITDHNVVLNEKVAREYSKKYGILVLPGAEIYLNGKEFLAIGIQYYKGTTFEAIKDSIEEQDGILIACHPFDMFGRGRTDFENFDAIEVHNGYSANDYKIAYLKAKEAGKAMVCGSDAHSTVQLGYTYCIIDSEKNIDSVLAAIKKKNVEPVNKVTPFRAHLEYYLRKYGTMEAIRNKKFRENSELVTLEKSIAVPLEA